ncbi:MAG: DUF4031 domain-containing protein [Propionibacteriaceae bacterium]|nr:DUF4031 domain-containing protein [Propionibacteriaceae bacterium]
MILIDPPRWPAHGTLFSHLVSDASLTELHLFARRTGLSPRAFDHDHYDVPAERHAGLVAAGALDVDSRELVRRLVAGGLRVRPREKGPGRAAALASARRHWDANPPAPTAVRDELLRRWREPHRHYHDVRHLAHFLHALDVLGAAERVAVLAAWCHDAVHTGAAGDDEHASAELAATLLGDHLPATEMAEIQRLVLLTIDHDPDADDHLGAAFVDADLAVLALPPARYHVYSRDVRLEYADAPEPAFVTGRMAVLEHLLGRAPLYRTRAAQAWTAAAHANLEAELNHLRAHGVPLVASG